MRLCQFSLTFGGLFGICMGWLSAFLYFAATQGAGR